MKNRKAVLEVKTRDKLDNNKIWQVPSQENRLRILGKLKEKILGVSDLISGEFRTVKMTKPETEIRYRFSKFCRVFKKDGIYALYHVINMEIVYVSTSLRGMLEVFRMGLTFNQWLNQARREATVSPDPKDLGQLLELLVEKEILVPIGFNEIEVIKKIQGKLGTPSIEAMNLILTDNCNMKCDYCFLEKKIPSSFRPLSMSMETAGRSIDLFSQILAKSKKNERIQLSGGEPLLNLETLTFAIKYIHRLKENGRLPLSVSTTLVTNGTLLNEEIAFFLKKHDVSVGVSIDGDKDIMDAHRKYKNGGSPYDLIIKNYWLLKKLGVKIGVSCTLTPMSLDGFGRTLEFLSKLELESSGLSFNILFCNAEVPVTEEYVQRSSECIFKAFERFRKLGIYEETATRKVKSFVTKKIVLLNCAAYGHQLVVYPQGEIGVCEIDVKTKKLVVGSVYDENFSPLENELVKEWSKRSPFYMTQCYDCEAIGICGGGCAGHTLREYGSIWHPDSRFCVYIKELLKWLIWDLYSQMQEK